MGEAARSEGKVVERIILRRWRAARLTRAELGSTAEEIRHVLAEAIIARVVPPGWKLSEDRLATLFDVSRTPIREALVGLSNSSLVRRDRRGSLRVASITADQILDVYSVRQVLEAMAASLAAQRATPKLVLELSKINEACAQASRDGDFERMATENLRFHAVIVAAAANELLLEFTHEIHTWVRRIPTTTLSFPGRAVQAVKEHESIVQAIRDHDSERADKLARDHMRIAQQIRMTMLVELSDATDEAG